MADELELLPPTLQNILEQTTLKWIFCGISDTLILASSAYIPV